MKKYIFTIALATMQILAVAQTVNVHFKNGQTIEYPSENVDYVDFSAKPSDPTITAGQVVDLGLSVYWASCNLGAEKPEEYGDYFAWGETKPKNNYSEQNYIFYDNTQKKYTYIEPSISGTQYDAATVNLGNDWRMPTSTEMEDLIKKCTWEKVRINNVLGYKVTSNNGNSIFLPLAGCALEKTMGFYSGDEMCYATGTWRANNGIYALYTKFSGIDRLTPCPIYYGFTIRPVTTNPNAGGDPIDHSQDYLVTEKISAQFLGGSYSSVNGKINSGSQLNVSFRNGSSETVTLVGIHLIDGTTNNEGNNILGSEVDVVAGESKGYTVTVGAAGIRNPIIRFTYRYNKKNYTVEKNLGL